MAKMGKKFDPSKVDTDASTGDFELLPDGIYSAHVSATDYKATKRGDGHYVELTFEIDGPTNAGRRLWGVFNLDNPNGKAVEIAEREFAQCLAAVGFDGEVEDTDDLLNARVNLKVGREKGRKRADGTLYDDRNRIKAYLAPSEADLAANGRLFANKGSVGAVADELDF